MIDVRDLFKHSLCYDGIPGIREAVVLELSVYETDGHAIRLAFGPIGIASYDIFGRIIAHCIWILN